MNDIELQTSNSQLSTLKKPKVFFATDHAGFELKEKLIAFVRDLPAQAGELGYEIKDFGAYELNEDDDYPDYVSQAAKAVSEDGNSRAIVLGGSGQGEAIVANRFPNVRAVVWYGGSPDILKLSREHNDANILSIGARFVTEEEAKEAVRVWLATAFTNEERHIRRIEKIEHVLHN